MRQAAADLEFEEAARLRDEIRRLEALDLGVSDSASPRPRSTAGTAGRVTGGGFGGKNVGRPSGGGPGGRGGGRPSGGRPGGGRPGGGRR